MNYLQEDPEKTHEVPLTKAEKKKLRAKEKQKQVIDKPPIEATIEETPLKKLEIIRPQVEKLKSAPPKIEKK